MIEVRDEVEDLFAQAVSVRDELRRFMDFHIFQRCAPEHMQTAPHTDLVDLDPVRVGNQPPFWAAIALAGEIGLQAIRFALHRQQP